MVAAVAAAAAVWAVGTDVGVPLLRWLLLLLRGLPRSLLPAAGLGAAMGAAAVAAAAAVKLVRTRA